MLDDLKKWKTTSSSYIVNDRWLKLRADACVTPEGRTLDPFYIFEYNDWVNCVVIDEGGNVVMVKQYRHGAQEYVLEIVAGGIEDHDASPEVAIKRELSEEIGYVGGGIYQTGISYANPANQTNKVYSFLAVGGHCGKEQQLEAGENLYIEQQSFQEFVKSAQDQGSTMYQGLHLASIFFALNYIRRNDSTSSQINELKKLLVTCENS